MVCTNNIILKGCASMAFQLCTLDMVLSSYHLSRVRDQHSREVSEMEEILEQQISEVKEDQLAKVRSSLRISIASGDAHLPTSFCLTSPPLLHTELLTYPASLDPI